MRCVVFYQHSFLEGAWKRAHFASLRQRTRHSNFVGGQVTQASVWSGGVQGHLLEKVEFELNLMVVWNLGRWAGENGDVCACVSVCARALWKC